ncbi:hypothetical protein ACWDYK_26095 [Streptomyces anthocyanicus]|uniref:hypothetical protein n=1 Tax=Streptomyces anthocyanicus TaxID=68174 RepID=UPI002F91652E|nr:hypothetical protein OHA15_40575 [Streptomyces anthocyanicus]
MPERIEVRTTDLRAVSGHITRSADSAAHVAERIRQITPPDEEAFGQGAAGLAARTEYEQVHQNLTALTQSISRQATALGAAVERTARVYGATQAKALEAVHRLG